ncbi:hypothetical protein D3C72_1440960 [compost metagenome]
MIWSAIIFLISLWTLKVEIPRLRSNKQHKELWIYIGLLSISALFSMAVSLKLPILNPLDLVANVFRPMGKMISTLLT